MSTKIMYWLMFNYIVLGIVYAYEKDYARVWYFLAALQINVAVLLMK